MNYTDLGNAERLIERYGKELRFCYQLGKWLLWDKSRWKIDEDGAVERRAKETVRAMYEFASRLTDDAERKAFASWALKSESHHRLNAMVKLAESEPGIPVSPDELDSDLWMFACRNGVVDIRTGELLKHSPERLITRMSPWSLDLKADCPKWKEHLSLVMDGNSDLISFLQRAYGSSLSGSIDDRKLFTLWGSGKNGKSICQETVAMILGDYALRTPVETLLVKRFDQIPNDLARLKGARFVYASEAESGKRLSESLVKDLTGGEKISARFLHHEWFEFQPTFKIFLSTNHKPVIRGTDDAIWDRICLIPFAVRISEELQRPRTGLLREFAEEAPGILNWLIHGAHEWYYEGLKPPEEVTAAVKSYREEMDLLGDFLMEKCVTDQRLKVRAGSLYEEYTKWCEENGDVAISSTAFGKEIRNRGCEQIRIGNSRGWRGLALKPSTMM